MIEYCVCSDCEPCACSKMATDPHCMWCCLTLPADVLLSWKKELAESTDKLELNEHF